VNQKLSIQQIQKELQLLDIKSPEGLDVWSWETIRIVLKDEMYIGKNIYTDRTKDPHHSPFDKDRNKQRFPYEDPSKWEIHMGKGVRIIDDETFYKVKKLLDRGKTRPTKKNYLLHGKLHCECGVDWVGRWYSKYDRPFYHCLNNERKYYRNTLNRSHLHKKNCNRPKRINGEMLDDFVWDNLLSTLRKSSWIKERVKKEILGERYGISSVRKGLNKERKQTKKVLNIFRKNRVQFIKDRYLNKLSDLDYNTILNSIDEKIFDCESMISQLDKKNDLMNQRTKWIDWLEEHHKNVDTYLGITKMKQRRRVIDFYIDDIVVGFDKTTKQHSINIKYKYPIVGDGLIRKGGKLNWDEWGVGYKIKKGENIFSLSSSNFFLTQKNYQTLLNRHTLCQVSWLIYITLTKYCHMVCK